MTEAEIQNAFWHSKHVGAEIIMPNYRPAGWWECDVWVVTSSGYSHEYEIKRTLSDFNADFKKVKKSYWGNPARSKHENLESKHKRAPKTFTYIVTADIIDQIKVPEYAGLIVVKQIEDLDQLRPGQADIYFKQVKQAPIINAKAKPTAREIERAKISCYFRMWNDRRKT